MTPIQGKSIQIKGRHALDQELRQEAFFLFRFRRALAQSPENFRTVSGESLMKNNAVEVQIIAADDVFIGEDVDIAELLFVTFGILGPKGDFPHRDRVFLCELELSAAGREAGGQQRLGGGKRLRGIGDELVIGHGVLFAVGEDVGEKMAAVEEVGAVLDNLAVGDGDDARVGGRDALVVKVEGPGGGCGGGVVAFADDSEKLGLTGCIGDDVAETALGNGPGLESGGGRDGQGWRRAGRQRGSNGNGIGDTVRVG